MTEQRVIVRAYGEEPVTLIAFFVKRIGKHRLGIVVGRAREAAHICLPPEDVFRYDAETFKSLRGAYDADDMTALRWHWRNVALPFVPDALELVVDPSTPPEAAISSKREQG